MAKHQNHREMLLAEAKREIRNKSMLTATIIGVLVCLAVVITESDFFKASPTALQLYAAEVSKKSDNLDNFVVWETNNSSKTEEVASSYSYRSFMYLPVGYEGSYATMCVQRSPAHPFTQIALYSQNGGTYAISEYQSKHDLLNSSIPKGFCEALSSKLKS